MAVVIETTLGDITVDLFLEQRPVTCLNFLKLCKMKYYNFNLFHTIRSGFIAQTGDPTGESSGGQSIWGLLEGPEKRFFSGEKMPKIRHTDTGLLAMVCTGEMMVGSQFYLTLGPDLDSLDGVHCVIGKVTEGHDVLRKLNEVICDETHRPYQDVRITHTVILEDPFNDPPGLRAPSRSPSPNPERLKGGRIAPDEEIDETQGRSAAEIQELIEEKEAKARATILEIVGDLPDADIAPPENVLFVCKLNPVTTDEDLEIIFSRFGKIVSCEVIRDKKTSDSLQYAFIEFADKKSCEDAYFKMDNVLIDDRRIHVDFSQSVSKIQWLGKGRGVRHINEKEEFKPSRRGRSKDREMKDINESNTNYYKHKDSRRYERSGNDLKSKDRRPKREIDDMEERSVNRDKRSFNSEDTSRKKNNDYKNRNTHNESREQEHKKRYQDESENFDKEKYKNKQSSRTDKSRNEESYLKHDKSNRNNIRQSKSRHSEENERKEVDNTDNQYVRDNNYKKDFKSKNKLERSRSRSRLNDNDKSIKDDNIDYKRSETKENNSLQYLKTKNKNAEKNRNNSEKKMSSREDKKEKHRSLSPLPVKKTKKKIESTIKEKKSKIIKKKKRKPSTSDSSSESSSSSSDTDSSVDKKKRNKKRKRKYSSSSSSSSSDSSTDSSSSSSSDSSSDSSSSDSDDDRKKRRKTKKKPAKTTKKKN